MICGQNVISCPKIKQEVNGVKSLMIRELKHKISQRLDFGLLDGHVSFMHENGRKTGKVFQTREREREREREYIF